MTAMVSRESIVRLAFALSAVFGLAGCSTPSLDLSYYWQSAQGHLTLMRQARPIADLLADGELDARLRSRLERVREIRAFASAELGLPANGSYTTYASLERPFVVWNVFAAPELSLQLEQRCFPVAGCVGYRGYFALRDAEREAEALRARGFDVHVAGVPAYSTLGWFDDPVLSTFVHQPEAELARLLFHELAHQVVYLKGDTTFNESFATAVEEAGMRRWLAARADPALEESYRRASERRRGFVSLLLRHKSVLEEVYRSDATRQQRLARKQQVFADLRRDYLALKAAWGGFSGYDRWFAQDLTNAHLAAVFAYTALVPGFERMLLRSGGDLAHFYAQVRELAALAPGERERWLGASGLARAEETAP